jgi:chaperonin GroEL
MATKDILFSASARSKLASGMNMLANTVKTTLGPRGRHVILDRPWSRPVFSKDGVSVAKDIELEDKMAQMGVQLIREVAAKTADVSGDGTTTATVLAQAIYNKGARLVAAGHNPTALKLGVDAAVAEVVRALGRLAKPAKSKNALAQIATSSANDDREIGELLATAMNRVGLHGAITVEESNTTQTTATVVDGLQFDRGWLSPYFLTDTDTMLCELDDPFILLHEKKITAMQDLLPVLEAVAKQGRPLLVIAEDVEGEALATLVVNKLQGTLNCCAVKAPGFGDRRKAMFKDLAIVTGGTAIMEELGIKLDGVGVAELGRARKVTIDRDNCTIVDGGGRKSAIKGRIAELRREFSETNSEYDRDKLRERIAKLSGGVAIIKVGATTEAELDTRKELIQNAINAMRAALEEGVVPGGGVALLRCQSALGKLKFSDEKRYGVSVVRESLAEPLSQIARNAGQDGQTVVNKVREKNGGFGFNAATGQFQDLEKIGIVDPVKVVRVALQNAASVAGLLLMTECVIAEKPVAPIEASATGGDHAALSPPDGDGGAGDLGGPGSSMMQEEEEEEDHHD